MTLRSGQAIQCGYAAEPVPGETTTPVTWLPVVDLPSLTVGGEATESDGIIAGRRVLTSDQWNGGNLSVGGDVTHELYDHGLDVLFRAMLGKMVQTGASAPYTHTHTPDDLSDDTLTVQYGAPSIAGGVLPATFGGCQVASWEIACQQGAIATLGVTFAGMHGHRGSRSVTDGTFSSGFAVVGSATANFTPADVGKPITGTGIPPGALIVSYGDATGVGVSPAPTATDTGVTLTIGTPLATPAYPTDMLPMKSMYLGLEIGGNKMPLQSLTLAGDNSLATDRYGAGSQFPGQALENGLRSYTGTIDGEFQDLAMWDRFRSGEEATVRATFQRGPNRVRITGNARFDENPPVGNGRAIVTQSTPIKFVASGADDTAIKIETVNDDNVT